MSTLDDARVVAGDVDLTPSQQATLRTFIVDYERLVRELAETDARLRHEHARAELLAAAPMGRAISEAEERRSLIEALREAEVRAEKAEREVERLTAGTPHPTDDQWDRMLNEAARRAE